MSADCFLVDSIGDAFVEGGGNRVGAMFWWSHATRPERDTDPRPSPHLAVMTEAGIARLDCPASVGEPGRYWTRTGTPPKVTATPSLHIKPGGHPDLARLPHGGHPDAMTRHTGGSSRSFLALATQVEAVDRLTDQADATAMVGALDPSLTARR